MVLSHPTIEWSSLQDVFYRKSELYSLSWGIENLADYQVAAASNAGLLALVRDPNRLVSVGKASLLKPKILVYTSAGQLIESIPWDPTVRIISLGFDALEQLVVVLEEGTVRIYTLLSPCPSSSTSSSYVQNSGRPQPVEATSNAYYTQHSLGPEATETGVLDARIWARGLVALVGARRFIEWRFPSLDQDADKEQEPSFAFASADDDTSILPVPELLPPPDPTPALPSGPFASSQMLPTAWSLVPPDVSSTGLTTVLIARGQTLLALTRSTAGPSSPGTSCQDMRLSRGPFHAIRPSPNGKLLALLTDDMKLWVVSSDLSRSLSEFDVAESGAYKDASEVQSNGITGEPSTGKGGLGGTGIRSIEWCGNNTVALAFNEEVVMVGPFGDSIRYPYLGSVHLVGELDGLRVISSDKHEFLQKVPDVSVQVFRPGSSDPAAILFDAAEQYTKKSSKANEGIRAIRTDLSSAVDTCLRAAAYEWDLSWQKRLLKAATFGKSFVDLYDSSTFVEMAHTLRVLNAARSYEIGIPISYDQYVAASPTALLSRLTAQNHHLLSLRIANYLNIRPDPILKHWARAKIARSKPPLGASDASGRAAEERICDEIVRKFKMATGVNDTDGDRSNSPREAAVSFAEVAWTAWKAGRRNLATRLLDHEARAIDQVPLLLNMHEDKLALVKAIESGDTDLIYHVLLRLKSQLSRGDFFRIVQAPVADSIAPGSGESRVASHLALASNLLEVYARELDRDLLRDFYFQDDRRTDSAILALEEAALATDMGDAVFKMKRAAKSFAEDKERVLEAKLVDEQVRLLAFQQALEREDGGRTAFVGLSLNETIRQCLLHNMAKKADKLRSDWKVPDRRFWHIKIDALIRSRDWDALWGFGNAKKSPVGYTPFIQKLVAAGHLREALRYVPKCADKTDRTALSSFIARLPDQNAAAELQAKLDE